MPGKGSCSMGTRGEWPGAALTHINELLLLPLRHLAEAVVPSRQVSGEAVQRFHSHLLHLSPLSTGAGWWQAQPTDAAPGPDPGGEHIALIEVTKLYLEQTRAVGRLWGGAGAGRGRVPCGWGMTLCAAPLPGPRTLLASRSVTCFMVRGLYPLCRS